MQSRGEARRSSNPSPFQQAVKHILGRRLRQQKETKTAMEREGHGTVW
jgi:hypothetical protein